MIVRYLIILYKPCKEPTLEDKMMQCSGNAKNKFTLPTMHALCVCVCVCVCVRAFKIGESLEGKRECESNEKMWMQCGRDSHRVVVKQSRKTRVKAKTKGNWLFLQLHSSFNKPTENK